MPELRLDTTPEPSQEAEQKQSHRLIVSEKHQQAIELLQYPIQELSQWVNQQLQENPLLELDEFEPEDPAEEVEELDEEQDDILDEIDWERYMNPGDDYGGYVGSRGSGHDDEHPENKFRAMARQHQTLHDSLEWQLNVLDLSAEQKKIASRIISAIDTDGLFEGEVDQIADEMDAETHEVEDVLEIVQDFNPSGVGGRNLEEVLLIQLDQLKEEPPTGTRTVIEDHLEDLQNRNFSKIADSENLDKETVQDIADLVRNFEPRPGRVHEPVDRKYLTPDVRVKKVKGEYVVIINEETPPVKISSRYRSLLNSNDQETREYVKDKLKGALWIMQCIYQRHETLHKVSESIVQQQKPFFEEGITELKPLVLKDVADDVGVHQSTVSRAVKDKYMQTDRGLFEMSFFFSSGLDTEGDKDEVSSTAVKAQIRKIVEQESKTDPLSDREVQERLEEEGIDIGRRTISKYRKQLQIPPWKLRKRVS